MSASMNRVVVVAALVLLAGCDEEKGRNERAAIHAEDMPAVKRVVRQDLERGLEGVRLAAERVRRGFLVDDRERLAQEMRSVLIRLRQPPRAITQLMMTPLSFIAAVDAEGTVICRDAQEDRMAGFDLAEHVPVVQRALEGESGYALSTIPGIVDDAPPSVTVVFAAPAWHDGEVVGAVVAGLPLWRLGQQLTRQLQLDNADAVQRGELLWVLLLEGDEQHYHAGFPPDLRQLVPDAERRAEGFASSPGGFTGELNQFGRWYGYGVLPVPSVGEDVSVVIFRSDPM